MSRTKRKDPDEYDTYISDYTEPRKFGNPEHRDKKDGSKPPGWFKRIRRRMRRSREKMAMRNKKEALPKFKNDDQWNWT